MDIWDLQHHFASAVELASPSSRVRAAAGGTGWEAIGPDEAVVGWAGVLEGDAPVWAAPLFGFEVRLGLDDRPPVRYRPLPLTPAVERDLALVLPPGVTAAAVADLLRRHAGPLLDTLTVFDEYRGPGIPPEHRSVAWHCSFRDPSRTLRENEVDTILAAALQALEAEFGVRRRAG
jgi:phenylalanyl-tRNA synthetase beta chain